MTDTASGFRSELRDTYRDPASAANHANGATQPTEPVVVPESEPVSANQSSTPESVIDEPINEQTHTTAKKVYVGASGASVDTSEPVLVWTSEQHTRFTLLIAGCSMVVAVASWVAMLFTTSGFANIASHDVISVLVGQAISGINIGLAVSIILWQLLKSNRKMTMPLALSNLFLLLLNLPIGIAIGVNIFYITGGSIQFKELLTAPFEITSRFYWVPFLVMPIAMVVWQLETMLIKRFFTGTEYLYQSATGGATATAGSFTVRRRNSTAVRCDICHKDDEFIAKTSFCRRCQRYSF